MHDYSISLYQHRLVGFFVLLLQNESVIHIVLQHAFFFFFFHFPMIMIIFPSQQEFLKSVRYFHVCICQNLLTNSYIGTIAMPFAFHSAVVFCSLPKKWVINTFVQISYTLVKAIVQGIFVRGIVRYRVCSIHFDTRLGNSIQLKLTLCYTRKPGQELSMVQKSITCFIFSYLFFIKLKVD